MPPIPTHSPLTALPPLPSYIHTTSFSFVDNHGRTLLLRGVNLSGASKAPVGHLSHQLEDFWESAECGGESFVGRPLNLEDGSADVHLARLRGWGFNLLRFPFIWEALEHEGPGKYDYEYMDYTIRVLAKCRDYGFRVYMDPHQDTWSRFSGGSGAPFWTLAACGINPRNITATQAAIIHSEYPLAHEPDPASLPAMIWSTNYGRLLSQTLFTLFFAGQDFAPKCIIDGVNIQTYLQSHFIEACGQLADRIAAYDGGSLLDACVIGWDSMNEPFEGLCGWEDLSVNPTKQGSTLKKGTYPTPAQSLRLGMGQKQTVESWTFGVTGPARNGVVEIDPKGRKVWAEPASSSSSNVGDGHEPSGTLPVDELPDGTHPRWGWKRDVSKWPLGKCLWAQHGVWDIETGFILRPDYFRINPHTGDEVEFLADYWKPHWVAYAKRIRKAHREAIIFVQPPVFAPPPVFTKEELGGRCVYAPHYYDGLTLITRHWNWFNADALGLLRGKYSSTLGAVKIGEGAIRKSLREQIGYLQSDVPGALGGGQYPTVIGEIGTPFDMDGKRAYGFGSDKGKGKGDYGMQERALDASLNACDAWRGVVGGEGKGGREKEQGVNWTVWTYVPDDHSHIWGDGWNGEDLSLWSVDDLEEAQEEEEEEEEEWDAGDEEPAGLGGGNGGMGMGEEGEGEGEEMDMIGENEDGLNSRAGLLPHHHHQRPRQRYLHQQLELEEGCVVAGSRRRSSRKLRKRQPERGLPMSVGVRGAGAVDVGVRGGIQAPPRVRAKMGGSKRRTSDAGSVDSTSLGSVSGLKSIPSSISISSGRRSTSTTSSTSTSSTSSSTSTRTRALALRKKTRAGLQRTAGYSTSPYTFLTDGARAVRAFARPWPTKVVGRAVDVRFEIAKGVLKMRVCAGWEDRVRGVGDVEGVDKGGEEVATEVYIPIVHYAHQRLLEEAEREREERRRRSEVEKSGLRRKGAKSRDDTLALGLECDGIASAGTGASTSTSSSSSTVAATTSTSTSTSTSQTKPVKIASTNANANANAPLLISDSTPDLVDIDVKISSGRYEVRGQTLMWWYDVPGEGEGEREYTLEVRRRGGVLKPPKRTPRSKPKPVQAKANGKERGVGGWCEEMCREGGACVVM